MHRFRIRRDETLFVGDMDRDEEAASRAGIRFLWAHEFFDWQNLQEKERTPILVARTSSKQM